MELGSSDAVVWMCMAVGWRRKDEPEAKRQKSRPAASEDTIMYHPTPRTRPEPRKPDPQMNTVGCSQVDIAGDSIICVWCSPSWRASPSFSKLLVYPMTLVSAEGKRSVQR